MKPREKDLWKVADWNASRFALWLRRGLELYYIEKGGVGNFKPFEYCVLREHTFWADLAEIFHGFPPAQAMAMKEGAALLLKELPVNSMYDPIFRTLLYFAEAVGATEVLGSIPLQGTGFRRLNPETADIRSLDDLALDVYTALVRRDTVKPI